MSKFGGSNNKKDVPGISSGSMSDIVFMLLFFFMVTTQMRETENKVQVTIPEATEAVKLERKDLACYVNIGTPIRSLQAQYGTDARIQLNDAFKTKDDIRDFVASERAALREGDNDGITGMRMALDTPEATFIAHPTLAPSQTMPVMLPIIFLTAAHTCGYPPLLSSTIPQAEPVEATTHPQRAESFPR